MVEALAGLELELVTDHLETRVINRVSVAVARVGIARRQCADDCAGRVLVHAGVVERDGRGRFVHVVDRDGEDLAGREAARVCPRHGNADGGFGLVVEAFAGLELELVANHLEACVVHGENVAVARVGVARRQRANHGARHVLVHARVVDRDGGRGFVQVVDRDGEDLVGGQAARIGPRHGDADGGCGLVVEAFAGLELELVANHLETRVVHGEGMGVARVRVARRQCADDRAGRVLVHAGVVERDGRRRVVDGVHREGDGRCCRLACAVGHLIGEAVRAVEVRRRHVGECVAQVIEHENARRRACQDREYEVVTLGEIGIGDVEGDGAGRILGHGDRLVVGRGRRVVGDAIDVDGHRRRVAAAGAVIDRIGEAVGRLRAAIQILKRGRARRVVGKTTVGLDRDRGTLGGGEDQGRPRRGAVDRQQTAGVRVAVRAGPRIVEDEVAGEDRVLVGRVAVVRGRRRLVHVTHGHGHDRRVGQAAGIHCPDRQRVAGRGFEIERRRRRDRARGRVDGEGAGRVARGDAVGKRVARIDIGGGNRAHEGRGRQVLVDGEAGGIRHHGRVVDRVHGDAHRRRVDAAVAIAHRVGEAVGAVIVRIRRIGDGAARIDTHSAMGALGNFGDGEREIGRHVRVVGQHVEG